MQSLIEKLKQFRDERNWKQFHRPENLAKSIAIEAAELLELFQWSSTQDDKALIADELADIISYCLLLADHYDFDVDTIIQEKIKKNAKKYPIDEAYGNAKKYTKLKKEKQ